MQARQQNSAAGLVPAVVFVYNVPREREGDGVRKLAYCAGGFSAAIFLAHFLLPVRWVLPGALAAVVLALVTLLLPGQTRRRVMVALLSAAIGFGWYAAATAMRLTPA